MELTLHREPTVDGVTLGHLFINGTFFCFTLEDEARPPGVKIPGFTCIAPGRYRVIVNMSQRFGRRLPLILDVPQFTGVRIHAGNSTRDTAGCILVGLGRMPTRITSSNEALNRLLPRIEHALKSEDVFLTISQQPTEDKRVA